MLFLDFHIWKHTRTCLFVLNIYTFNDYSLFSRVPYLTQVRLLARLTSKFVSPDCPYLLEVTPYLSYCTYITVLCPLYINHCTCPTVLVPLYLSHCSCHNVLVTLYLSHYTCHTVLVPLYLSHCTCHTVLVPPYLSHCTCSTVLELK